MSDRKEHAVFVDGLPKGEAYRERGRWWWRRPSGAIESMPKRARLDDLAEWARNCCNGKRAEINCGNGRRARAAS